MPCSDSISTNGAMGACISRTASTLAIPSPVTMLRKPSRGFSANLRATSRVNAEDEDEAVAEGKRVRGVGRSSPLHNAASSSPCCDETSWLGEKSSSVPFGRRV